MAIRPAYFTSDNEPLLVEIENFEFKWHPGLSITQKQKSIKELHDSILKKYPNKRILEISSKSQDTYGNMLSAFNLTFHTKKYKKRISVETAFQSSKVFVNGGPYYDLLDKTSREAKKDIRIKESGDLTHFMFFQEKWDLIPITAFYDWIYINALNQHKDLVEYVTQYDCFTDIEFNPEKSINCQARSADLFNSLLKKNILMDALSSKESYLGIISTFCKTERQSTPKAKKSSIQYSLL